MKGQVLHASVVKVVGSNLATVHLLLGVGATGVLRPAYKLRAKLAPLMAAVLLSLRTEADLRFKPTFF